MPVITNEYFWLPVTKVPLCLIVMVYEPAVGLSIFTCSTLSTILSSVLIAGTTGLFVNFQGKKTEELQEILLFFCLGN